MTRPGVSRAMWKALRLAEETGAVRRLPGGYWVAGNSPREGRRGIQGLQLAEYVSTGTVAAVVTRGLMEYDAASYQNCMAQRATITAAGRATLAGEKEEART